MEKVRDEWSTKPVRQQIRWQRKKPKPRSTCDMPDCKGKRQPTSPFCRYHQPLLPIIDTSCPAELGWNLDIGNLML